MEKRKGEWPVKTMRNEESKRLLEAAEMKWKTEMMETKQNIESEKKKEIEKIQNECEEMKKKMENQLKVQQNEIDKLKFDLKNVNVLFDEYKTRTNK